MSGSHNTNNTAGSSLVLPEVHISLQVLEVTSILIIIVFGLFGNLCVCFVVFKNCDLWTVPNLLIVNLSISDLFRIIFSLTVSCIVLITREWIGNDVFCQINGFYTLVFLSTSLLCVTLISINRYFIIVRPSQSKDIFSRRNTKIMVAIVWFVGIVSAVPPLVGLGRYDFNGSRATCFIANGSSDSYTSILVIILIGVPCSVTIWCYIRVFVTMRLSKERLTVQNAIVPQRSETGKQSRPKLTQREIRVASTMLLLVGVYLITWVPISVIHFLRVAGIEHISTHIDLGAALLISWSCVTNPWIYGFKNTYYRDQIRKMLCMKTAIHHLEKDDEMEE